MEQLWDNPCRISLLILLCSGSIMQFTSTLDKITNRILRILTKDGRISNADLADKVGLSPSACLRRVQKLEQSGIIKGYKAELDYAALGKTFTAYIGIGLSDHSRVSQQIFEDAVQNAPEIVECHNITGSFEYLLRVETDDLKAYKLFHRDVLGTIPHLNSITTFVVLDSPKSGGSK